MSRYIVVATADEIRLLDLLPHLPQLPIIVTGVGGTNVINALDKISRESEIINVGYAGSVDLARGEIYQVQESRLYHKVPFSERTYILPHGNVPCLTSTDFVTEGQAGVLFDMELAFICAMGFKSVVAYKVVSDNCNLKEYEEFKNK